MFAKWNHVRPRGPSSLLGRSGNRRRRSGLHSLLMLEWRFDLFAGCCSIRQQAQSPPGRQIHGTRWPWPVDCSKFSPHPRVEIPKYLIDRRFLRWWREHGIRSDDWERSSREHNLPTQQRAGQVFGSCSSRDSCPCWRTNPRRRSFATVTSIRIGLG